MKTALSIAGSDCSAGAGIQADIKTMLANGVYATTAITALTAQNTTGVRSVLEVPADFLEDQLDMIFEDIVPDAVKIGMVSSPKLIDVIARKLRFYKAKNIVLDPVMVSTSGSALLQQGAKQVLSRELFGLCTLLTPNIPEAQAICGFPIQSKDDMHRAAKWILERYGCAVLLKGGHRLNDADDLFYAPGTQHWFCSERIDTTNTHGTGCTLSSAIAANLAKGHSLLSSIERAKAYVHSALSFGLDLGQGSGPMHHGFALKDNFCK